MTTKDSAGDKLVASIRKTKSAVATSGKTSKKKVARKTTQSPKQKVISAESTESGLSKKASIINLFHSGRRVWPD